jgi:BMFP domain-containing protein YqiC
MTNTAKLDELARKLADALPEGARVLRADVEKNFRAALSGMFAKMDLVTREEFDVQSAVLARTRAKLERLEHQIAELETALRNAEKT